MSPELILDYPLLITDNSSLFFQVGHPGFEPGTSPLSGVRSNQLS